MANPTEINGAIDILDNVAAQTAMGRNDHVRATNAIQMLRGFTQSVFAAVPAKISGAETEETGDAESSKNPGDDRRVSDDA